MLGVLRQDNAVAVVQTRERFRHSDYAYETAGSIGTVAAHFQGLDGTTWVDRTGVGNAAMTGTYAAAASIMDSSSKAVDVNGVDGVATIADKGRFAYIHNTWIFYVAGWMQWDDIGGGVAAVVVGNSVGTSAKGFSIVADDRGTSLPSDGMLVVMANGLASVLFQTADDKLTAGTHHVCLTCDDVTARLYIDAVEVATGTPPAVASGDATNAMVFGDGPGGSLEYDGRYQEWGFGTVHLTPAKVLELYSRGAP